MVKRIIWTDKFSKSLESLFACLHSIYSIGTLRKLGKDITRNELLLPDNPQMGSIEESLSGLQYEYRSIVIKPYFKIIYRNDKEDIYFIDIWDTRRDPSLLKKNIEESL